MAQQAGLSAAWCAAIIALAACAPAADGKPELAPPPAHRWSGPATLTMSLPEGIGLAPGSVKLGVATVRPDATGFSITDGTEVEMIEIEARSLPGGRTQQVLRLDEGQVARLFGPDGEASRVGPGEYASLTLGYRFCRTGAGGPGRHPLIVTSELLVGSDVVQPRESSNLRDSAQGRFLQGISPCDP